MNNVNTTSLYLALVHHPIVNKRGDLITTSVTNLDLHDIARSCKTFGFKQYFVVTPIEPQAELVKKILGYWDTDTANDYNPDRTDALGLIRVAATLENAIEGIEAVEKIRPILATTQAKCDGPSGNCAALLNLAKLQNRPILLVLGTGWGLHNSIIEKSDFKLDPIPGFGDYNHLSVRSAAAIYTSRLSQVILP